MKITLKKEFFTITELMTRWEASIYDVRYIAEHGLIKIYARPAAIDTSVYLLHHQEQAERLRQCPLSKSDIYRLFCCTRDSTVSVCPLQDLCELCLGFDDMVALATDIEQFENENHDTGFRLLSPDFSYFIMNGQEYMFGETQAKIIKHLWQANVNGNPWQYGKRILADIGSGSDRIKSVFNHNPDWKNVINSDGKGKYKLNLPPSTCHTAR